MSQTDAIAEIKVIQGILRIKQDGDFGKLSHAALESLISEANGDGQITNVLDGAPQPAFDFEKDKLVTIPNSMITLTQDGVDMIIYHETGGRAYYEKVLSYPSWPVPRADWDNNNRNKSGVTIGIGYDLGQETTFESDWKPFLGPDEFARLSAAVGLQRRQAQAKARELRAAGIRIPWPTATAVFLRNTLGREATKTENAYPGVTNLHPNVQAALMSMVYQWGPGIRLEAQRGIKAAVARGDYNGIAAGLRSMKGLASSDGDRRELEARYVLAGAPKPSTTRLT